MARALIVCFENVQKSAKTAVDVTVVIMGETFENIATFNIQCDGTIDFQCDGLEEFLKSHLSSECAIVEYDNIVLSCIVHCENVLKACFKIEQALQNSHLSAQQIRNLVGNDTVATNAMQDMSRKGQLARCNNPWYIKLA